MLRKITVLTVLAVLPVINFPGGVQADDCIRSCTARLYVHLTYQPVGQANMEKKTGLLKTAKTLNRDGRAGNSCLPHNIFKAKQRGCTEAVRDLVGMHSSGNRQMQSVCEAVQYSETLIPRSNVQDEIFPKADWYRIDQMEVKGHRDAVKIRSEVEQVDHRRFRCDDGRAFVLQAGGQGPPLSGGAPPSSPGSVVSPPPPAAAVHAAPPPPPTLVTSRNADLFISEFEITPSDPVQGQPVEVRVGVYNRGTVQSGPFTVKWWPGENFPESSCSWNIEKMAANGGRILTCRYEGYPSWYARINTMAMADTENTVRESVENNNKRTLQIKVSKR